MVDLLYAGSAVLVQARCQTFFGDTSTFLAETAAYCRSKHEMRNYLLVLSLEALSQSNLCHS